MIATKPVKMLNPRSADTNILGSEPAWKTQPTEFRITALTKAPTSPGGHRSGEGEVRADEAARQHRDHRSR